MRPKSRKGILASKLLPDSVGPMASRYPVLWFKPTLDRSVSAFLGKVAQRQSTFDDRSNLAHSVSRRSVVTHS